jgi:hypothetical protein
LRTFPAEELREPFDILNCKHRPSDRRQQGEELPFVNRGAPVDSRFDAVRDSRIKESAMETSSAKVALQVAKSSGEGLIHFIGWAWRERRHRREQQQSELAELNHELSGDALALIHTYIVPNIVGSNPADVDEDAPRSPSLANVSAANIFSQFFDPLTANNDDPGSNVLFVLADAGMGKTSILKMLRLDYLGLAKIGVRWPSGRDCQVHKLQRGTLPKLAAAHDPASTILLLDALDEDPAAWGQLEERLMSLLGLAKSFHRKRPAVDALAYLA